MWDLIFGAFSIVVGGYLVGATKDEDPNRKMLKGWGIFLLVIGSLAFGYGLAKMYVIHLATQNNGGYTNNPMYEMPQSAVVEPAPAVPAAVNAPNGTVIVNNPAPGNVGVAKRNNMRTN